MQCHIQMKRTLSGVTVRVSRAMNSVSIGWHNIRQSTNSTCLIEYSGLITTTNAFAHGLSIILAIAQSDRNEVLLLSLAAQRRGMLNPFHLWHGQIERYGLD